MSPSTPCGGREEEAGYDKGKRGLFYGVDSGGATRNRPRKVIVMGGQIWPGGPIHFRRHAKPHRRRKEGERAAIRWEKKSRLKLFKWTRRTSWGPGLHNMKDVVRQSEHSAERNFKETKSPSKLNIAINTTWDEVVFKDNRARGGQM